MNKPDPSALDRECFERVLACQDAVICIRQWAAPDWRARALLYSEHVRKLGVAWAKNDEPALRSLLAAPPFGMRDDHTISEQLVREGPPT